MWMDDSNRGGGEPPHRHGPIINVVEVAFVDVNLSLPGFQAQPDHPTEASFVLGVCGHGDVVFSVQGCAILPLPRHVTRWQRLVIALRYLTGRITAPKPDMQEAPNDGA